jgi:hypothetical protein
MKNEIHDSLCSATEDVFDGWEIGHAVFGTASPALSFWEALYRKNVKKLRVRSPWL